MTPEEELLRENEELRCEVAFLKKYNGLNSSAGGTRTPAKIQAIQKLRQEFDVTFLIKYGKVVRSTYYYHEKKDKKDKYDALKNLIKSIYNKHKGRYGYRRITDELLKTVFFEYKNKLSMEENSILFKFAIGPVLRNE